MTAARLLLPLSLALLAACASAPQQNVSVEKQSTCPLQLKTGQNLILTLPSNPTTGYRWAIQDSAGGVLRALSPEVYSSTESGVIGGGQSTWRFQAFAAGQGRLRLTSLQPWEPEAEPTETFDCAITVN
jgi:inhibitor of cysteine peptidase